MSSDVRSDHSSGLLVVDICVSCHSLRLLQFEDDIFCECVLCTFHAETLKIKCSIAVESLRKLKPNVADILVKGHGVRSENVESENASEEANKRLKCVFSSRPLRRKKKYCWYSGDLELRTAIHSQMVCPHKKMQVFFYAQLSKSRPIHHPNASEDNAVETHGTI